LSTHRRQRLVAVATALLSISALTLTAAPVLASAGASGTEVHVFASTFGYGEPVPMLAIVWDNSDSCSSILNDCDMPEGTVDFYAVQGATQTFLVSSGLYLDLDATYLRANGFYKITDLGDDLRVSYCCLEPGTYVIRGYYVPGNFDPSSADSGSFTVTKGAATTTMTASPSTAEAGDTVTFHLHVASAGGNPNAAVPTGSISVSEGSTTYGTGIVDSSGNATVTSSTIPNGSHSLHARYSGDSRYNGSSSDDVDVTIANGESSSSLATSHTSITYGDSVTLTDTVSAIAPATGTPTGTVTFKDGGSTLGSHALDEGDPDTAALSVDSLDVGSHTISATYGGDVGFLGSTSNSVTVDVAKATTSVDLTSDTNPSTFGQPVTFTASVSGGGPTTPSGTVQFKDGSSAIGAPQPVIAGISSLTIGSLAGGSHSITAVYSGSANYQGSTSNAVSQTVTCDHTITGSVSSLTLSSGSTCLSGAKVSGNVTVSGGGSLSVINSTISGGLKATGSASSSGPHAPVSGPTITICGSTIAGSVTITGAGGFVLLGDVVQDACAGNWLKGSVSLTGNYAGLALADNRIGGYVKVVNNVGAGPSPLNTAPIVAANVIGGTLTVRGNSPAATDTGRPNHSSTGQVLVL